jgi:hypothetical protein
MVGVESGLLLSDALLSPIKAGGWMGHLFTRGKMEPGAEPDWN